MHIPVLVDEVIKFLNPEPKKIYVDATLGCGGYTEKLLTICPDCCVIGIDFDEQAIQYSSKRLKQYIDLGNLIVIKDSYVNIKQILSSLNITNIDGAMMDLGISTLQLKSNRGFSFNDDSLDMRMSNDNSCYTAEYILNNFTQQQLADIFYKYGEEKNSIKIAKKIIEYRKNKKITTAKELVEIVNSVYKHQKKKRIKLLGYNETITFRFNPATKVFQALRIFINNELNNLQHGLNNIIDVLSTNGKIAVVSYHSLEDRTVKNIFRTRHDLKVITKKPITPSPQEIKANLSARSAKLRVAEKL